MGRHRGMQPDQARAAQQRLVADVTGGVPDTRYQRRIRLVVRCQRRVSALALDGAVAGAVWNQRGDAET